MRGALCPAQPRRSCGLPMNEPALRAPPSRLQRRLNRVAGTVALIVATVCLTLAAVHSRQLTIQYADQRLSGAEDLVRWSWHQQQQRIDAQLHQLASMPGVRNALIAQLSPSRRGSAPPPAMPSLPGGWQLQLRSATGSLVAGEPHSSDDASTGWLFTTGNGPAHRLLAAGNGRVRLEASLKVRRFVERDFQSLGYVLLRLDSTVLDALQSELAASRQVSLRVLPRMEAGADATTGTTAAPAETRRERHQERRHAIDEQWDVRYRHPINWSLGQLLQPSLLGSFAVLLLLAWILGWRLRRRITEPLDGLLAAAAKIANGDFDIRLKRRGTGEMALLHDVMKDMADRMHAHNSRATKLVYRDSLTGLPNRRLFMEHLNKAVAMSKRQQKRFALMFLDLDGFKHVNDSLGHQAGDRLLIDVSRRVERAVRDSDIVAATDWAPDVEGNLVGRLGGDEFLVLLNDLAHPEDAAVVADRLLTELRAPIHLDKETVYVGASIGVTLYPDDAGDADSLLRNADVAMYQAKSSGKNTYKYYAAGMNVSASEQLKIQARLRESLDQGGFQLHLQPVFCSKTGSLLRAEALIRWTDAELGPVSPAIFIPIAESSGDVSRITKWVINEVCKRLAEWSGRLPEGFQIAFNMSNVDVLHGDIREVLRTAMESYRVDPARIVVEITESGLMSTGDRPIEVLESLRSLGVGLALDDFGTGYSSLSYLQRFPINELKIDRSFIAELTENPADQSIVRAILSMAHSMSLAVTAEGVETEEHLNLLRTLGCEKLQGYLFSPPMNADRFIQELSRDAQLHRWSGYWVADAGIAAADGALELK